MHRLVRVSPFDSERRRHTSFAKVVIYPDVDEFAAPAGGGGSSAVALTRDDVRIETFRSSGPGDGLFHSAISNKVVTEWRRRPARAEDGERGSCWQNGKNVSFL